MYLRTKGEDLRKPFIDEFLKVAETDDKLIFITMDVGFSFLESVKEKLKERFFNFGITEPSSIVIAAALAKEGWRPYIYSMIPFVTWRVHEQVRNAIVMHKAPVILLGVEGSSKYSFLGFSHNLLNPYEEIKWLQDLMPCYLPQNKEAARTIFHKTYQDNKAAYIRL